MRKLFVVLGSIFLALIVLVVIGIAFVAVRGNALDKESKAYADAAIPAVVTSWNQKELLDRASPEFKQAVTEQKLDQMFRWFSSLGRLQKCAAAEGHSFMSVTSQNGKTISAKYASKAQFEKGEGDITLVLIKHGDHWQIAAFDFRSPQLVPPQCTLRCDTVRRKFRRELV
jgi:hypothetical protein